MTFSAEDKGLFIPFFLVIISTKLCLQRSFRIYRSSFLELEDVVREIVTERKQPYEPVYSQAPSEQINVPGPFSNYLVQQVKTCLLYSNILYDFILFEDYDYRLHKENIYLGERR